MCGVMILLKQHCARVSSIKAVVATAATTLEVNKPRHASHYPPRIISQKCKSVDRELQSNKKKIKRASKAQRARQKKRGSQTVWDASNHKVGVDEARHSNTVNFLVTLSLLALPPPIRRRRHSRTGHYSLEPRGSRSGPTFTRFTVAEQWTNIAQQPLALFHSNQHSKVPVL